MMSNSVAQRLRTLKKENKSVKQMVADLMLGKREPKIAFEQSPSARVSDAAESSKGTQG